jgi:hypothetical protein
MAKHPTYPVKLEDLLCLSIKDLNKGSLLTSEYNSKSISWSTKDLFTGKPVVAGSMDITVTLNDCDPYMLLEYETGSEAVNEKIKLVSLKSNLGAGRIWYFICPATGKGCSKLHLYNGRFMHREAITSAMYENQTLSKKNRSAISFIDSIHKARKLRIALQDKYAKIRYNGRFTKRMRRLITLNKRFDW